MEIRFIKLPILKTPMSPNRVTLAKVNTIKMINRVIIELAIK